MSESVTKQAVVNDGWGRVKPSKEVDLPSGSKVLLRELEIPDLISLGVLDLIDTFSQKVLPDEVSSSPSDKSSEGENFMKDLAQDKDRFNGLLGAIDRITAAAVVNPKVYVAEDPEDESSLEEDKIYAHLIPFDDRMVIFENAVEGMGDLFRLSRGQTEDMADMADEQSVSGDAKLVAGGQQTSEVFLPQ